VGRLNPFFKVGIVSLQIGLQIGLIPCLSFLVINVTFAVFNKQFIINHCHALISLLSLVLTTH
jgi:hypothetical protein